MRRACQAEDGLCRPIGVVGSCTFRAARRNRNGADRFPPQPNGADTGAVMVQNRVQHGAAHDCKEMKSSVLSPETQRGCASSCEPAQPRAESISGRYRNRTYVESHEENVGLPVSWRTGWRTGRPCCSTSCASGEVLGVRHQHLNSKQGPVLDHPQNSNSNPAHGELKPGREPPFRARCGGLPTAPRHGAAGHLQNWPSSARAEFPALIKRRDSANCFT